MPAAAAETVCDRRAETAEALAEVRTVVSPAEGTGEEARQEKEENDREQQIIDKK